MMKNILSSILILGQILLVTPAKAALSESDRAILDVSKQLLKNPGFENGSSFWTASGGATATANATAKGTGALGYDWDSNAASQTLTSTAVTIPNGLQGKNGVISCNIKTVSGTATHTLGFWDGTTLSSTQTITNSTTSFAETKINLVFPASGTAAIRLTSVNANEPEIYIDDCKISLADNIGTVAQAILVDAVTVTGCAGDWTTNSATFATMGTQTGCTYTSSKGVATAPSTNIAGFRFPNGLPAGDYKIEYEGSFGTNYNSGATGVSSYQFWDGTNTAREKSSATNVNTTLTFDTTNGIHQSISYSTPQSNVTFELRALSPTAGSAAHIRGNTTSDPGVFKLWYFPSSSQQAVSSAQADYDWASYTAIVTNMGTSPSILCKHRRVDSNLEMECNGTTGSGTQGAGLATIQLPNSLQLDSSKIVNTASTGSAGQVFGTYSINATSGYGSVLSNTGSSSTVLYFGYVATTSTQLTAQTGTAIFTASTPINIRFTVPIQGWSSNQRAPTLVGSVTSNSAGAERIERAFITGVGGAGVTCGSTPCTITSQSGSWLTSVTRASTGNYTINYSTPFMSSPVCSILVESAGVIAATGYSSTTSTGSLACRQASTGSAQDCSFNIICQGPR